MTLESDQPGHAEPDEQNSADFASSDLSDFLPYQLSITSNAVSALIAERYRKRFGLKIAEWRIIAVLGDAAAASGLSQRALTDATVMDKVAVNRACKVLEERGLLTRAPNDADGRSHLLVLTGEGKAIRDEVMPLAKATERELFAGLTQAQQSALRSMLEQLRGRAGEMLQALP